MRFAVYTAGCMLCASSGNAFMLSRTLPKLSVLSIKTRRLFRISRQFSFPKPPVYPDLKSVK
jgi:hypothetical protein